MKTLVLALIAVSALATTARADGPCEQQVKTAVDAQVQSEKLGLNAYARLSDIPATELNKMDTIRVPVRDIEGTVIKSYNVMVGETCEVMSTH